MPASPRAPPSVPANPNPNPNTLTLTPNPNPNPNPNPKQVCTTLSAVFGGMAVVMITKQLDHVWDLGALCNGREI